MDWHRKVNPVKRLLCATRRDASVKGSVLYYAHFIAAQRQVNESA